MCSSKWTAGVAVFEKGSLGDTGAALVVCEAFLCIFTETTEKESISSLPHPSFLPKSQDSPVSSVSL